MARLIVVESLSYGRVGGATQPILRNSATDDNQRFSGLRPKQGV